MQQRLILFSLKMCDIQCIFESMTGKGSIFISNLAAAQNTALLQGKGIQAILTAARSGLLQHTKESIPFYLYLPADDHQDQDIDRYFPQTFDFIEQARKHTNVLVHCIAGISRSVTIVIAYLIKKFKYSLEEVLAMMQRKRNKINPNRGFMEQLRKYAEHETLKCIIKLEQPTDKDNEKDSPKVASTNSKEVENKNEYILNNPLARYHDERHEKMKLLQKTAATKQDICDFTKESKELKQENRDKTGVLNGQDSLQLFAKVDTLKPLQYTSVPLRKRFSFDSRRQDHQKKLTFQEKKSIEQKIMKVRQKIQQKGGIGRPSARAQPAVSSGRKENSLQHLKLMLQKKKPSAKNTSQYLSLGSTGQPTSINAQLPDDLFNHFCDTEGSAGRGMKGKAKY